MIILVLQVNSSASQGSSDLPRTTQLEVAECHEDVIRLWAPTESSTVPPAVIHRPGDDGCGAGIGGLLVPPECQAALCPPGLCWGWARAETKAQGLARVKWL
jgi:hypothetical protein